MTKALEINTDANPICTNGECQNVSSEWKQNKILQILFKMICSNVYIFIMPVTFKRNVLGGSIKPNDKTNDLCFRHTHNTPTQTHT